MSIQEFGGWEQSQRLKTPISPVMAAYLYDITPAAPLDCPNGSQKRLFLHIIGASKLYSRQFNAEEFSQTYLCTMRANLRPGVLG